MEDPKTSDQSVSEGIVATVETTSNDKNDQVVSIIDADTGLHRKLNARHFFMIWWRPWVLI